MTPFWKRILDGKESSSAKRLITLVISLHFILSSFVILFIAFYVIFYIPKGKVDKDLLELLKQVLEYDMYIILSGLGFIAAENIGQVMVERAKAAAGVFNIPQNDGKEQQVNDI